jgi:hypothetical protein
MANLTRRDDDSDAYDERFEHIAQIVHSFMREGESLVISNEDGEILISTLEEKPLRKLHPRLYGRLASVNEQLTAGCSPFLIAWFLGIVIVCLLQTAWIESWWGEDAVRSMRWWGFYVALFAGLTLIVYLGSLFRQNVVYRRVRDELHQLMRREGIDRDSLIALIWEEPDLRVVMARLRLDTTPLEDDAEARP